jgi:hypothetical protein
VPENPPPRSTARALLRHHGAARPYRVRARHVGLHAGTRRRRPGGQWVAEAPHLKGKTIKTRLDLAAEELAHALETLGNGATVGVIAYSESAQWISKGYEALDAALREKLSTRVRALNAGCKTNIFDGLNLAFRPEKKTGPMDTSEGPDTLFLLSDGNPSTGKIEDIQELREAEVLRASNLGRAIKIHCVNVGDADARLLRALASTSGRQRHLVPPAGPPSRPTRSRRSERHHDPPPATLEEARVRSSDSSRNSPSTRR